MRNLRIAISIAFALLWGMSASAITLRLRASDQGVWGAELRACKHAISIAQCANITPLVLKDSGIAVKDLGRLPNGQKILVRNRYLQPGFMPSAATIRAAEAIFGRRIQSVSNDTELRLRKTITSLQADKQSSGEALRAKQKEMDALSGVLSSTQQQLTAAEKNVTNLKHALAAKHVPSRFEEVKELAEFVIVALVAAVLTWLSCALWFRSYKRESRILPLVAEEQDESGKWHAFDLEDDNTYTCRDCQNNPEAQLHKKGHGLRLKNLKNHLDATAVHANLRVLTPIERTA